MTQFLLTDYGNERILQAIADETTVEVYALVYGDGGGYQYIPQKSQTSLIHQIDAITNIDKTYNPEDGFIYFSGTVLANSTPCTIRELGLIDTSNKLLAVGVIPDTVKPEAEDGLEVSLPISMGFKTSIGEVMTVYISAGDTIATKDWVDDNYATVSLDNLNDDGIKVITDLMAPLARNIGEIVASTIPLTNAGLHLLDGALIDGSGSYSDFVDYIADLYNDSEITPEWNKNTLINLPTFSSNTQDGITISDSRDNTTVLQAIFNGTNNLNQIGYWSTYWININYNQATIIDSYTIQADNGGAPEYPSTWTLQASNDGTNWDILDTQTGVTFSLNQSKTFSVVTQARYEQYRLVFSNGVESSDNGELKKVTFNAYTPLQTIENTYFTTENQWQQSVATYGVCGKFVYDSVNNTVRLPKITGFTEGTIDPTTLGDLTQAGLPNITGTFGAGGSTDARDNQYSGAFSKVYNIDSKTGDAASGWEQYCARVSFDASRSSSIYSNSNTVQPQSTKVLYYIVIANITKTQIQVDIDKIATDLNGKADVDLSNVNNTGTSKVAHWALPSGTYTNLTLGSSGASYTAPANGWYCFYTTKSTAGYTYLINDTTGFRTESRTTINNAGCGCYIPARQGDIVKCTYDGVNNNPIWRFYYAQGSESEAN